MPFHVQIPIEPECLCCPFHRPSEIIQLEALRRYNETKDCAVTPLEHMVVWNDARMEAVIQFLDDFLLEESQA